MQQYREIKSQHQDAILFFRMGDFYEMFYDDAETASRALGLTLTSRNNGGAAEVPLAGVPVKAATEYLRRLVSQGFRVSICEQIEDPRTAKGIVKRAVVETITPGASFADDMLTGSRGNYVCAVRQSESDVAIAAADISTGEFRLAVVPASDADAMLSRFAPREVLVPMGSPMQPGASGFDERAITTERSEWEFDPSLARELLARQFDLASIEGLGIGVDDDLVAGVAGALLRYLQELQPAGIAHLARPRIESPGLTMPLDEMTRRNLELVQSLRSGDTTGTLLAVLDRTRTPMGARMLREWILAPLRDRTRINSRLDCVGGFAGDAVNRSVIRDALDGVRDIERLSAKIVAGRASPRDIRALGDSISRLPDVESALSTVARSAPALSELVARYDRCADIADDIIRIIVEKPPVAIGESATVLDGVDARLDESRALRDGGKDGIVRIQADERARTGINSLKVGYNKVFGYFIEVTNTNSHLVPADYQRRQTLTGAERYVTPALKEFEERVLSAGETIEQRERAIVQELCSRISAEIRRLQCIAGVIGELDVLSTLADVAERENYARPEISEEFALEVEAGRHPVVERMMPRERFIPNDVNLAEDARLIILTGPNMAGKSTILRQIGLIVLMAQMGSFVPATRARIGIVDRLFTRVGASDNLVRGQSTFMVEMAETSAILNTATSRSLVLLDEIGRGTSTYDGVSIAWAVSEHIHERLGCKTVFATHYHELTQLTDELVAARNYNVEVREVGEKILFLHRLSPGGADRSYGIEVGRIAGLPAQVIARARELLRHLEGEQIVPALSGVARGSAEKSTTAQLPLFQAAPSPIVETLRGLDPDTLTPLQALELLARLVGDAKRG